MSRRSIGNARRDTARLRPSSEHKANLPRAARFASVVQMGGSPMKLLITTAALLLGAASAQAQQSANLLSQNADILKYVVNRNGGQIGTFVVEFHRNGP